MRRRLFALVAALAPTIAAAPPAVAQSPVQIGAPLTGEVVLNRDVEVRIAPNENARIIMTLEKDKPLNALGTPRGTTWTQVAIGGQPIGYVPADSLDPALAVRPLALPAPNKRAPTPGVPGAISPTITAAVTPKAAWDKAQNNQARGYVVALEDVAAPPPPANAPPPKAKEKDKGPKGPALRRGDVAAFVEAVGEEAQLIAPGGARVAAPLKNLLGVIAGYPLPGQAPLGVGTLYAARLGEYYSYGEGRRAWDAFVQGPGGDFRDRPPMVWPALRGDAVTYQMGIGPFSARELDNICPLLAQRGFACAIIELARF